MTQNANQNDTLVWRIKTEEEFIEEYGDNWHKEYSPYFIPEEQDMKQLLGACISKDCFIKGESSFKDFTNSVNPSFYLVLKKGVLNNNIEWKIAKWMITDKPFIPNKKRFSKSKFAKGDVIHVVKSFTAVTGEKILKGFQGLVENVEHLKEGEGWDKVNFYRYELSFMIGRKTVKAFAYEDEIKLPAVIYHDKDMINKLNSPQLKKESKFKIGDTVKTRNKIFTNDSHLIGEGSIGQVKNISEYKKDSYLYYISVPSGSFTFTVTALESELDFPVASKKNSENCFCPGDKVICKEKVRIYYNEEGIIQNCLPNECLVLFHRYPIPVNIKYDQLKKVITADHIKSKSTNNNKNQSNNLKTDAHGTDNQKTDEQSLVSRPHRSKITERTVERGTGLKSNRIQSKLGSNDRYN